jgi:hypothetical protein
LAHSRHGLLHCKCPLSGVKRTLQSLIALHMSAIGPKRTSLVAPHMSAFGCKADMAIALRNVRFPSLPSRDDLDIACYRISREEGLVRLNVARPDHLAPLVDFVGHQLARVCRRAGERPRTHLGESCLELRIGQSRVDLPI